MKRLLLSLILLSFILSVVSEGVGFWRRLDPVPVAGAPGQAIVGTGEHLFLIRTDGETNASQFWTYDGDDRRWTDRSEDIIVGFDDQDNNDRRGLSDGLFQTGTAMAWVNDDDDDNFLYILGGGSDDGDHRAFYRLDIRNLNRPVLERLADTPHDQGEGNAMVWDPFGKRMYALIGSERLEGEFVRYDPRFNRWETLPFPEEWNCLGPGSAMVSFGAFGIYALEGDCRGTQSESRFVVYDLFRSRWTDLNSLPASNGPGGSLLNIGQFDSNEDTFIYAFNGGEMAEDGQEVYRYNIDNGLWRRLELEQLCPVGGYPGNRAGYVDEAIHIYQGAPGDFPCRGDGLLQLLGVN